MTDKALKMLGLMRRADAIEIGADRSADAARAGKARVLALASDAGENAAKKAEYALSGKNALKLELPFSRKELSEALGVGDCTMAAVTDIGFAEAFVKLLSADDPERYGDAAQELERRHEKMQRRKKKKGTKGQAKTIGKRRTNI